MPVNQLPKQMMNATLELKTMMNTTTTYLSNTPTSFAAATKVPAKLLVAQMLIRPFPVSAELSYHWNRLSELGSHLEKSTALHLLPSVPSYT